jgi:hypothetical protein
LFRARCRGRVHVLASLGEARTLALQPHQVDSPLAGRPYDLRHAISGAGTPAFSQSDTPYAKCVDGHESSEKRRIQDALGDDGDADDKP